MRISDWSSDVCSSDLIAIGDADPRLVMRGVIEADVVADGGVRPWIACGGLRLCRPRHQREDRARQNMPLHMFPFFFLRTVIGACDTEGPEQGPEGALPDDKYDLILLSHQDRKSVVRGKSGSVRVDPGGRSINKKKKKK